MAPVNTIFSLREVFLRPDRLNVHKDRCVSLAKNLSEISA
jgi:hypothetical protein